MAILRPPFRSKILYPAVPNIETKVFLHTDGILARHSQDFGQYDLAGVHARTHARFHRRGQQRLPNPLGQAQPGPTRTLLQQGELRLADLCAD